MTTRATRYPRLHDFDYSFLPSSFWQDDIYYTTKTGPCISCGETTARFNNTIGTWECIECGDEECIQ